MKRILVAAAAVALAVAAGSAAAAAAAAARVSSGFAAAPVSLHLGLYRGVLIAHSAWRWVVIIAGFAAVVSPMMRLSRQEAWTPVGPQLARFFGIAIDIQVLMGAALYLLLSPLTTIVLSTAGMKLPPGSQAHFFVVTHPAIMIVAFIAVHVSSVVVRRARSDAAHQRRAIIFYGVTLLIVLAGIPWWRPLLRF
ncbi:MAG TPA: hypothetical protein VHX52_14355 [Steroidobacteraceae bacterium]|jgi:hypothetical protein|nr:hypothetical protein [Steroidobacteraceae bacterium]